jgi:hypothetical protein
VTHSEKVVRYDMKSARRLLSLTTFVGVSGHCLIRVEHSSPYADGPFDITCDRRQPIVSNQSGVRLLPAGEVATGGRLDVCRRRCAKDDLFQARHHGSKMILPK